MADYFAVLQRTLSGFEAPQAGLREKLYERARLTIRRQLDGRVPAWDDDAISAEMAKLDQAIFDIENQYGDSIMASSPPTIPVFAPPETEPEPEPVLPEPTMVEVEPEALVPPLPEPEAPVPPQPPIVEEVDPIAAALADFTKADEERKAEADTAVEEVAEVPLVLEPEAPTLEEESVTAVQADDAANNAVQEALAAMSLDTPSFEPASVAPMVDPEPAPPVMPAVDPAVLEPVAQPTPEPAPEPPIPINPQPPMAPELQPVDFNSGETADLAIPPAHGFSGGEKRKRKSRWLLWLLLILLILGGAAAAFVTMKDSVLSALGMDGGSVTAVPTKVKTIKVSPEPEAEPVPDAEESSSSLADEEAKSEARLNSDGEEVVEAPPVVVEPESTTQPTPAAASNNRAFLYEENASGGASGVDNGTVSWSIVQEAPAPGQAEEPAIRAQIEIPGRKTVLILTIKRNADQGLSASHIIETIFAVPDDFSGGAINEINRIVMKESEEGRGETLTASSVKISEGIFLVALDNLAAAKTRNEELLQTRGWIDIPVQYRTGKRALMTIEKGSEGEAVFKEVFANWEKAT